MTDLSKLRGEIDTMRRKHGKDSPTGSRLSMLFEQSLNYEKAETPQQQEAVAAFMARTQAELAQIQKDGGEYIPENHIPGNRQAGEG